jgi:hypothetical protein
VAGADQDGGRGVAVKPIAKIVAVIRAGAGTRPVKLVAGSTANLMERKADLENALAAHGIRVSWERTLAKKAYGLARPIAGP